MFTAEDTGAGAAFKPMRRAAAINMQADAHAAEPAAGAHKPPCSAGAALPHLSYSPWAPQAVVTTGAPGTASLPARAMRHVTSLPSHDRSPALADMGALWKYLDYCGAQQRQHTAVQVRSSIPWLLNAPSSSII